MSKQTLKYLWNPAAKSNLLLFHISWHLMSISGLRLICQKTCTFWYNFNSSVNGSKQLVNSFYFTTSIATPFKTLHFNTSTGDLAFYIYSILTNKKRVQTGPGIFPLGKNPPGSHHFECKSTTCGRSSLLPTWQSTWSFRLFYWP